MCVCFFSSVRCKWSVSQRELVRWENREDQQKPGGLPVKFHPGRGAHLPVHFTPFCKPQGFAGRGEVEQLNLWSKT